MDTGTTLTLNCHVWRDRLAWAVVEAHLRGRRRVIARGLLVRPFGAEEDEPFLALLVAAMEAWRLNGPRTPHPEPKAPREPLGGGGGAARAPLTDTAPCASCGRDVWRWMECPDCPQLPQA